MSDFDFLDDFDIDIDDNNEKLSVSNSGSNIQKSGYGEAANIASEIRKALDQSTKGGVTTSIEGSRVVQQNDIHIKVTTPNGSTAEIHDRSRRTKTSLRFAIALVFVVTVAAVIIISVASGTIPKIILSFTSSDKTVKSPGLIDSLLSWLVQFTPFCSKAPEGVPLSTFHQLLGANFVCLCIYLCFSIILGAEEVNKRAFLFITVLISTIIAFWFVSYGINWWLLAGLAVKHQILSVLFTVLIDIMVGCILLCVLIWVEENYCHCN